MGIPSLNLSNINLDNNFGKHDPDAIILVRLLAWQRTQSTLKKDK